MLKLKFKTIIICCVLILVCSSNINIFAVSKNDINIGVSASSAVLYCANTGEFIFNKNSQTKMPMASTTKIMTSLLALEYARTNDKIVTITTDMYAEGSSMYLKEGDKVRLSDLAVGMLTVSGNDAANACALSISNSFEKFAKIMNDKAKIIGMKNTNFVTPSGLDDENHYSTAQDMALLMSYAMKNKDFKKITSQQSIKVDFIKPKGVTNTYSNHNKLLSTYNYCNGGKTGYTSKAGRCLVSSANKNGIKLIAVTLYAGDDWSDHINMYENGFEQFTSVMYADENYNINKDVVGGEKNHVEICGSNNVNVVTKIDDKSKITREVKISNFLYAPINKGEIVGEIVYKVDDKIVKTNNLIANSSINYKNDKNILEKFIDFFKIK